MMKHKDVKTSHSLDNLFDACPRKFEFLALYDQRPKPSPAYAADVGTALHEAMQAWLIARAEGADSEARESAACLALAKHFPWELEDEQSTATRDFDKTTQLMYAMIEDSFWNSWDLVKVDGINSWGVEIPFLMHHKGFENIKHPSGRTYTLQTQGKMDLVLQHRVTKQIATVDIKTTVHAEEHLKAIYTFSGQQIGYSHIMNAMLGVNPKEFEVRYFVAKFGTALEPPKIIDLPIQFSESLIADYWQGKYDVLNRIKNYLENGFFPRTNSGCLAYHRVCSCFDICHTRKDTLIQNWYSGVETVPTREYEPLVELDVT